MKNYKKKKLELEIEQELQRLASLGQTPDEIAARLAEMGLRGFPNNPYDCPVSNRLEQLFPQFECVKVMPATRGAPKGADDTEGWVQLYFDEDNESDESPEDDRPDCEVDLPVLLNQVTCRFDLGLYPALQAANYVPGTE